MGTRDQDPKPTKPVEPTDNPSLSYLVLERTGSGIELGNTLDTLKAIIPEESLEIAEMASVVRSQLINRRLYHDVASQQHYVEIVTEKCKELGITVADYRTARLLASVPEQELPPVGHEQRRAIRVDVLGPIDSVIGKSQSDFRRFFPDPETHRADLYEISYKYVEARHRLDKRRDEGRDELTGLIDEQGYLSEVFELELNLLSLLEEQRAMLVMRIDIDNFKKVNDVYGHEEGDRILKEFSANLEAAFGRSFDVVGMSSEGKGVGGRPGGDEFVAIVNDVNMVFHPDIKAEDFAHFPDDLMEGQGIGNEVVFLMGKKVREAGQKVILNDGSGLSVSVGIARIHQEEAVEMLYGTNPAYNKLGFKDYNNRADQAAIWAKEWGDGVIAEWGPKLPEVPMTFERLRAKAEKAFSRVHWRLKIDDELSAMLDQEARLLLTKYEALPKKKK